MRHCSVCGVNGQWINSVWSIFGDFCAKCLASDEARSEHERQQARAWVAAQAQAEAERIARVVTAREVAEERERTIQRERLELESYFAALEQRARGLRKEARARRARQKYARALLVAKFEKMRGYEELAVPGWLAHAFIQDVPISEMEPYY